MSPQVGDIWQYHNDDTADYRNLLVLSYNELAEAYTCLELETGKQTGWSMRVDRYPELWRFIA